MDPVSVPRIIWDPATNWMRSGSAALIPV